MLVWFGILIIWNVVVGCVSVMMLFLCMVSVWFGIDLFVGLMIGSGVFLGFFGYVVSRLCMLLM